MMVKQEMRESPERSMTESDISVLRQLIGRLARLVRSSRPTMAFRVARIQQMMKKTTVKDLPATTTQ